MGETSNMETLSIIGNICSILGFLVALFLTSKIISIKNSFKDSSTTQKDIQIKNGDVAGHDINK